MATERKITHNMHGVERTCSRCSNKPTVIRVKSEYLCNDCKLKRIERIGQGRARCGNCEDRFQESKRVHEQIDEMTTVEDVKWFLMKHRDLFQ